MASRSCSTTITLLPISTRRRKRLREPSVVARVQPYRRLVEHVEHADERGADLGGEADPLALAARERLGRAVEREVVESDVDEKAEAQGNGLEQRLGDGALASVHPCRGREQTFQEGAHVPQRQSAELGDVLVAELDGECFGPQASPTAGVASARDSEAAELVVTDGPFVEIGIPIGIRLFGPRAARVVARGEAALEPRNDSVVGGPRLVPPSRVPRVSVQDGLSDRLGQLLPGEVGIGTEHLRGPCHLGLQRRASRVVPTRAPLLRGACA